MRELTGLKSMAEIKFEAAQEETQALQNRLDEVSEELRLKRSELEELKLEAR